MDTIWNWLTENSDAATAIGTIFSAFTALIALFLSAYGLRAQRRHDVLSARPLPEVTVADYENSLRVKLRNNGVGPMMVKSVKVIRDGATRDSLIQGLFVLLCSVPNGSIVCLCLLHLP